MPIFPPELLILRLTIRTKYDIIHLAISKQGFQFAWLNNTLSNCRENSGSELRNITDFDHKEL